MGIYFRRGYSLQKLSANCRVGTGLMMKRRKNGLYSKNGEMMVALQNCHLLFLPYPVAKCESTHFAGASVYAPMASLMHMPQEIPGHG